jgi:AraC-like DNA-binding protein
MGAITALFARKLVRAAGPAIDQSELLRSIGLSPDGGSVEEMVSDLAYYDLFERVARAVGDATDLPLRTGRSMRCDDYGAFGLAWKTAPTLRASLARAERYWRLLTSVSEYEVRPVEDGAYFILHRSGERRLGMRLSNEATLASVVSIVREVLPLPFVPREVHLRHPPPSTLHAHRAYFGCPVRFDSELDALLISSEALVGPTRQADDALTRFLLDHLDAELRRVEADRPLEAMVRDAIARSLSEGVPRMQEIARRLGLSERTLQRRLGEEGLSFQRLVDGARREFAEGLLVQSDYSLAEIAFLAGFSEQSAFNRAFRRWADATPAAYREARRAS